MAKLSVTIKEELHKIISGENHDGEDNKKQRETEEKSGIPPKSVIFQADQHNDQSGGKTQPGKNNHDVLNSLSDTMLCVVCGLVPGSIGIVPLVTVYVVGLTVFLLAFRLAIRKNRWKCLRDAKQLNSKGFVGLALAIIGAGLAFPHALAVPGATISPVTMVWLFAIAGVFRAQSDALVLVEAAVARNR